MSAAMVLPLVDDMPPHVVILDCPGVVCPVCRKQLRVGELVRMAYERAALRIGRYTVHDVLVVRGMYPDLDEVGVTLPEESVDITEIWRDDGRYDIGWVANPHELAHETCC